MILTAPIIVSIFLSALCLLPGLVAAGLLVRLWAGNAIEGEGEGQRAYLLFLLLLTAFGIRVLAWPLGYLALDSAIPHVSGAMCIFGVTRLVPFWANLLQVVRPLLVLALGGWLVLRLTWSTIHRATPGPALPRTVGERLLLPVSLVLLLADCICELVVLLSLRPDHPVYCCGSVYDLPDRFSSLVPQHLFGAQHARLLLPLTACCGLLVVVLALAAGLRALRGRRPAVVAALLGGLLPLLFGTAFLASMEVLAPRFTGLPFHHCLYCLLGKTGFGPWLAVSLAAGLLCTAWGCLLLTSKHPGVRRPAGTLLLAGGLATLIFLVITAAGWSRVGQGGDLGRCPACQRQMFDSVYLVEVVSGGAPAVRLCSTACAREHIERNGLREHGLYVTVRDEFTGTRLDTGAAFFVEAPQDVPGLPPGNRWHVYQYLENAHVMAFELGGNIVADPFGVSRAGETRP